MEQPNYNKIVVFDTETTGMSPPYLVSLAFRCYENSKLIKKDYIIVNPKYPISPGASKVNGFTDEQVMNYPDFKEQWENIKEYFENAILIAHNISFDKRVLLTEFARYNIEVPTFWTCDTLENAKMLVPKKQVNNYKLGTLCDYFGFPIDRWHEADADCYFCLKVFNKLVQLSNGQLIVRNKFNERVT